MSTECTSNDIYKIYRKIWPKEFQVLNGQFTDEEAQQAVRGIGAGKENFLMWALSDVEPYKNNPAIKRLQIKATCDYDYNSYLIYLNFI